MKICDSVANNNTYLFTKDSRSEIHLAVPWGQHFFISTEYWEIKPNYHKNFFTSLYNSVRRTQRLFVKISAQWTTYSVVLDHLIACIHETVDQANTALLFKIEYLNKLYMSRMEQLGVVLKSTQPESRERTMLTHFRTWAKERKRHPPCTLTVIWLIWGMRIWF